MLRDFSIFLFGCATAIAMYVVGWVVAQRLQARRRDDTIPANPDEVGNPTAQVDLALGIVRERLTKWIAKFGLIGDANIRGGIVVETIPPGDLGDVSNSLRNRAQAVLAGIASGRIIGTDLYVKRWNESGDKPYYTLADLTIDDVSSLVVLAERVAEDRRRSRSLYKGLTDEETTKIARSAASRVFPEKRYELMSGAEDDGPCIRIGRAAVEQLFSIKGAGA
jgi:hypothetical protein